MIQRIPPWVKDLPGVFDGMICHFMYFGRKGFEGCWYDKITKPVEDYIYFHSLHCLLCQVFLKLPANLVIFPDVRFQVDTFLSTINASEHCLIEIAAIVINLKFVVIDAHWLRLLVWKRLLIVL